MKGESSVPASAWNSRIAIFPVEPDIKSYLKLSDREYEERAGRYSERGVNLVNATYGFHYRFDFIEHFKQIAEITARISRACHKHGIKVYEHNSANFISTHTDETYLEWDPEDSLVVDIRTGAQSRFGIRSNTRAVCINNPDFKDKFRRYIVDFIEKTGVDGLMHDDIHFGGQYHCGCGFCREKFKNIFGYELPEHGKFPLNDCSDPVWRDWLRFHLISSSDQICELRSSLPENFLLFSCMGAGCLSEGDVHQAGASMETAAKGANCIFSEEDGGFLNNKNRAPWKPRNYFASCEKLFVEKKYIKAISSSFAKPAFDLHYPAEPKEGFFCWAATKIFGNCLWRCDSNLYGGYNYPDEFQEWEKEYDYFNWEKSNEKLFGPSGNLNEIGVVFSQNTKLALGVNPQHHGECFSGWMQTLQGYGYAADCILDRDIENAEKLASLKVLILPNAAALSRKAVEAIKQYVYSGGKLIATHKTSLLDESGKDTGNFQLKDLFGCSFLKERAEQSYWFIENRFSAEPVFSGNTPVFRTFPTIKVSWEGESVHRDILGWAERTTTWHEEEQTPAVTRVYYGKGEAVYIASKPGFHSCREGFFNIWQRNHRRQKFNKGVDSRGRSYHEWSEEASRNPSKWFFIDNSDKNYKLLIRNLMEHMVPSPSLRIIKPAGVMSNLFVRSNCSGGGKNDWVVGLLNTGGAVFGDMEEVSPPVYLHYPPLEGEIIIIVNEDTGVKKGVLHSPDIKKPAFLKPEPSADGRIFKIRASDLKRVGFVLLTGD